MLVGGVNVDVGWKNLDGLIICHPHPPPCDLTMWLRKVGVGVRGWVRLFTFQVHSGLKTFPEATGWTVLPPDLINDAVISPRAQVVVLACTEERKKERLRRFMKD